MFKKIKYSAKNMRPECNEMDCITCNYFDHKKGYCSADNEIKDCSYCKNAFTDLRLHSDNDLSYTSIGRCDKGFGAFICSAAIYRPPVKIIVQKYREDIKRNVDVFHFTPIFCPVCGRKIVENEKILKEEQEKYNSERKKNNDLL